MRDPKNEEILVYGRKPVLEILQHRPERIQELYLCRGASLSPAFQKALSASEIRSQEFSKEQFEEHIGSVPHQGVATILRCSTVSTLDEFIAQQSKRDEKGTLLILDQISDPQNLGALFRIAEAAGVDAVLFTKDRSAGITPAVRKTSAGASELLTLVQIGNLQRALKLLKEQGYWIVGTEVHGESQDVYTVELPAPLALILGSEGGGLRQLTAKRCDMVIHLPIAGAIESLNVSQAAAVILYELYRRRNYEMQDK